MVKRLSIFSLAIVLAFICVISVTGSVLADDELPVDAPPLEEGVTPEEIPVEPPAEEALPAEEQLVEEPSLEELPPVEEVVVEEPILEEAPPAEEVLPVEEPAAEAAPLEEAPPVEEPVVEEIPLEETAPEAAAEEPLVLVDGEGEPLTLATEETAELLETGDPYFLSGTIQYAWVYEAVGCASVTPLPGYTLSCTEVTDGDDIFAPILTEIKGGKKPNDGKIYVEAGTYNGYVFIDGENYPTTLGVLNGLIGLDGSALTTLHGTVDVVKAQAGFTLSGFTIDGSAVFTDNKGTLTLSDLDVQCVDCTGIEIDYHNGAVVLSDVESSDNGYNGMWINHPQGVYPVTITNAEFDDNGQVSPDRGGLFVTNKGTVTLNGLSASRNGYLGAMIDTNGAVSVKNSTFIDNEETGLYVNVPSSSAVTLENVQAASNGQEDGGSGIQIGAGGTVTARNVIAFWNDTHGMYIHNAGLLVPTTVSIYGSSFPVNNMNGLMIEVKGNVLLSGVYNTSGNGGAGVNVNTCLWTGTACSGTGTVTMTSPGPNTSDFAYNSSYGVSIDSAGAVTLTGISAKNNGQSGVSVVNNYPGKTGGVTIKSLPFVPSGTPQSAFSDNGDYGIFIRSNGAVAISGYAENTMRVDRNTYGGICISCGTTVAMPTTVTLTGIDLENNGSDAVKVNSRGAIALTSVHVNNPDGTHMWTPYGGIVLYNYHGTGGVTLTDVGVSYTGGHGIEIHSKGAVTLTRVNTFRTGLQGIYINNTDGVAAVTLTNVNVRQPHDIGILIWSKGNVTLSGVNAEDVGGVDFTKNAADAIWQGGSISDQTWFHMNITGGGDVVDIKMTLPGYAEYGILELVNRSTGELISSTEAYGATLALTGITLPVGDYFIFYYTRMEDAAIYDYQLIVKHSGNADPSAGTPLTAHEGISISNTYGAGNVSISGSTANPWPWVSDNSGKGISVYSNGTITVKNITLHRNGETAVGLNNTGATYPKTVTVADLDIFRSGEAGLVISSIGAVSMTRIHSSENLDNGIRVNNCQFDSVNGKCRGTAAVSLLASSGTENYIANNGQTGLFIMTVGLVTLNNINIENNGSEALRIQGPDELLDAYRPLVSGITLASVGGYWNRVVGHPSLYTVWLSTYGPVSLANLQVSDNGGRALMIKNERAITPKPVTLTNVDVYNNHRSGITIISKGAVTLNGTASSSNYERDQVVVYDRQTTGAIAGGWRSFFTSPAVTLAVELDSELFQGELKLFKASGEFVVSGTAENRGDPINLYPVLTAGDYYLEFSPWDAWRPYDYDISIYPWGSSPSLEPYSYLNDYDFYGVQIQTGGDVTIATPAGSQRWWYANNAGWGIDISTNGAVRLQGLEVSGNYHEGIDAYSTGVGKLSTLANLEVHDNGVHSWDEGIVLNVRGPVTMTNLNVTDNRGTGVVVNNCAWNGTKCQGGGAVTLNATSGRENYLANNGGHGLSVYSVGLVTLSNFHIENHPVYGIYIDAPVYGAAPYPVGGVTITSSGGYWNSVHNNMNPDGRGISILTYGPVSLARLDVFDNAQYGIFINNSIAASAQPVTLTDVKVWHSHDSGGIHIKSRGNVTLYGVSANENFDSYNWLVLGDKVGTGTARQFAVGEIYFEFEATDIGDVGILFQGLDFQGQIRLFDPWGRQRADTFTNYDGEALSLNFDVLPGEDGLYTLRITPWNDGLYYYYLETTGGAGIQTHLYAPLEGIYILNTSNGGTGNVTLAKSTANPHPELYGNSGNALVIYTNGALAISDLSVYRNGGNGISSQLYTAGKTAALTRVNVNTSGGLGVILNTQGAVTLTDVNIRRAKYSGLEITATGAITLTRVESIYNEVWGALLHNDWGSLTPGVTITDSTFSYNQRGLGVFSKGLVKLLGVGVENNFLQQASVPDGMVSGGVTIKGYLPGLDRWDPDWYARDTKYSFNNDNAAFDLNVVLHPYGENAPMRVMLYKGDGTLLEFGSTASGEDYAWEGETWLLSYTDLPVGSYFLVVRAGTSYDGDHYWGNPGTYEMVIGTGTNLYSYQDSVGAKVTTNGGVTVDKGVTTSRNWFNGNDSHGLALEVYSPGGNVLVANSDFFGNNKDGLKLNLWGLGKTTTLNKLYLGENKEYNLNVNVLGTVSWTSGDSGGSSSGAYINNSNFGPPNTPYAVTISGVNFHNAQNNNGLTVHSYGNVSLTSVSAWENAWSGVMIDNCRYTAGLCPGSGAVAVNNSNGSSFFNNGYDGLYVNSKGNVTLTNVESNENGYFGVAVDNQQSGAGSGAVTLTYTLDRWVSNNRDMGIQVISNGAITLTSAKHLWVQHNCWGSYCSAGIFLDNGASPTSALVKVEGALSTSINTIDNNGRGLVIYSKGAVTVKNTNAYINMGDGIQIGDYSLNPVSVTLTYVVAQQNGRGGSGYGVYIYPAGTVTIFGLDTRENRGDGLYLYTDSAANVTVKKSVFRENHAGSSAYGLNIQTKGNVLLDSVNVTDNDQGARVNTAEGTISMLGTYFKNEILGHGINTALDLQAKGNISVTKLDVKDSGGSYIQSSNGSVTMNTVYLTNNAYVFWVLAKNGAAFTRVVSLYNGMISDADGILVHLTGGLASFTDCAFHGNSGSGIEVWYDGIPLVKPTLIRTTYLGNDADGSGDWDLYYH